MEYKKNKCRRCGYELVMPEETVRVYCGSCGEVNSFGRISSILKKYNESLEIDSYSQPHEDGISEVSYPDPVLGSRGPDRSENDGAAEFPENKNASKVITAIMILIPFLAMAADFFKLPSYAVIAVIILIMVIVFFKRK